MIIDRCVDTIQTVGKGFVSTFSNGVFTVLFQLGFFCMDVNDNGADK